MILAIDTATRWTGLALHDGLAVIAELGWQAHNTQTVELVPAIAEMLQRADMHPADLKGIAVAIGPGSYTGLRIGLGAAKGLALANHTPLLGIPTLDVMAASISRSIVAGQLMAVIEAGRTRVSAAPYRWERQRWVAAAEPDNYSWPELLGLVSELTTFVGEISVEGMKLIRTTKNCRMVSPAAAVRRPAFLAEIGWQRLRQDDIDDPRALTPLYFRSPEGS